MKRKFTKQVKVGKVLIGGSAPISIQSMTKTKTIPEIIREIKELQSAGCELVRIAVPDFDHARALKKIKKEVETPIIADIHYNYRLALEAIKSGADKIRINPGNIGSKERVKEIVKCAKEYNIPIRIGVNSGSLEPDLRSKYGATAKAFYESAKRWTKIIENFGFTQLVLSLKSSDPLTTISAYRKVSKELNYPLHLGVTAVSGGVPGIVKSTIGIGTLLLEGIGDTIRVSLTGPSIEEIKVGKEILMALNLSKGIQIIACPTCARCEIDVEKLCSEVESRINSYNGKPLRIAVMGCIVNGPGEAKDADFGITGGKGMGFIFKKEKVIKKVPEDKIVAALMEEICNG